MQNKKRMPVPSDVSLTPRTEDSTHRFFHPGCVGQDRFMVQGRNEKGPTRPAHKTNCARSGSTRRAFLARPARLTRPSCSATLTVKSAERRRFSQVFAAGA